MFVSTAEWLLAELLLFSAFFFALGALDDFAIDVIWFVRRFYRRMRWYRRDPPMRVSDLSGKTKEGLLAIFVPAWREAAVIGQMLGNACDRWSDSGCKFRIYVGCYPNDASTISVVRETAKLRDAVNLVISDSPGPTSKADCLNWLWEKLLADELACGRKAKAVILHDAEDLVHADELTLFSHLIETHPAVQIPVLPLPVKGSGFISSHYCDEFAEAHAKTMVVREALGAAIPLAGVGCAIRRDILGRIALENGQKPFDADSLTEDYELGFKIAPFGQTILARMRDDEGQLVCSRAHFPHTLKAAVRQKTRWMTGIALAGWDKLGWSGNAAQKWMLLRDRKAVLAAITLTAAYICLLLAAGLAIAQLFGAEVDIRIGPLLAALLWVNFAFLIWRIAIRMAFVTRFYGWRQGLLSVPRIFVSNIIAIMAARRACWNYLRHLFGKPLSWDKTEHSHFPAQGEPEHS